MGPGVGDYTKVGPRGVVCSEKGAKEPIERLRGFREIKILERESKGF